MTIFNETCVVDRSTFESGYAVIKNLATTEVVEAIDKEINKIIDKGDSLWLESNSAKTERDEYVVIRSIDTPSDLIFKIGRDSLLFSIAEEIGKKKVTPMYSEYFSKPPKSKCETPVHQDQAFYEKHFNDELGITFWIALTDCDGNNGGMHIRPNQDRVLLPHVKSNVLGFGYQMVDQSKDDFIEIRLNKGDALVHCAYTPHFCHPNKSSKQRRAIAITFRTSQYRQEQFE